MAMVDHTPVTEPKTEHDAYSHDNEHPPHLQHHFDNLDQQFDAGKLGMWIFLATEVLLFGGLFCAYSIYRANHPDIFFFGHRYLDTTLGAINTAILIFSSFTMAWAVRCSQLNQIRRMIVLLLLTILCGFGFMGIKYVEYKTKWQHGLLWGTNFNYDYLLHGDSHGGDHPAGAAEESALMTGIPEVHTTQQANPNTDQTQQTHAVDTNQAVNAGITQTSAPDATQKEPKTGRQANQGHAVDTASGQPPAQAEGMTPSTGGSPAQSAGHPGGDQTLPQGASDVRTTYPPTAVGPSGLAMTQSGVHSVNIEEIPEKVHVFFGIYFVMTGLHGLHVIMGVAAIAWIAFRGWKGEFSSQYYTPVDLVGLYWHVVDLIWIYLFPLLYLIH